MATISTTQLRWLVREKRVPTNRFDMSTYTVEEKILQQAFVDADTNKTHWIDVPTVQED